MKCRLLAYYKTLVNKTLCVDLTCYVFWFTVLEAKFRSCEKQFKRLRFSSGLVPYCEGTGSQTFVFLFCEIEGRAFASGVCGGGRELDSVQREAGK